jgi:hypothetical protein
LDEQQPPEEDEIGLEEMLGWAEFCAWSTLVMTPVIWWLQGASVSTDQFVVRTSLVVISALVGIGLRIRAWIVGRREAAGGKPQPTAETPVAALSDSGPPPGDEHTPPPRPSP